jgi:haloalkane dehalogenase
MQDWGGPLGLRYAAMHRDRVARLFILNTGLMSGEAATLSPGLLKWREYAERTPDLPSRPDHQAVRGGSRGPV